MSDNVLSLIIPVKDAKLMPSEGHKRAIADFLRSQDGNAVTVRLSKPRKPRSVKSNAFYWASIIGTLAGTTGHSPEEIHFFLKKEFLPRSFIKLGGKEIELQKSTTELTTQEFSEYLDRIRAWAAQELQIALP